VNISNLLEKYREPEHREVPVPGGGVGRLALLREKFASRLAEATEVRLRAPATSTQMAIFARAVDPNALPEGIIELYMTADGETSSGFFVPELEFLRIDYSVELWGANSEALAQGLLPPSLRCPLPIFRDSIGNQIVVILDSAALYNQMAFIDMEKASCRIVSKSVESFVARLVQMKKINEDSVATKCPGDFRSLTSVELEVAHFFENRSD
jgi:hypothetical protein